MYWRLYADEFIDAQAQQADELRLPAFSNFEFARCSIRSHPPHTIVASVSCRG
jgi:hypothetical protein